ncbi:acyl-CoA dehydrogenase NM domain-like protein [Crassisporium funariophilum]|nr:acyl-CoA dehydrogenase NM domain-like protein [Crassisporium funariophilum]
MESIPRESLAIISSPAFQVEYRSLSLEDKALLSLKRAREITLAYALTEHDVRTLTPKFWQIHADPALCIDAAATSLMTIQLNLGAGTVAPYVDDQPYLRPLLEKILRFEVTAQFCLTEVDHGLDAINVETTATLLSDGTFELHTPHRGAAKFMPPTAPCGLPCVGIVFARLKVQGADLGVRPFVVDITDGKQTCPGITSKLLPPRGGSKTINHCITSFNHVTLPATALLGRIDGTSDPRLNFLQAIWRAAVGSLAIVSCFIPLLQILAFTVAKYSQRRRVAGPGGARVAIIGFKTQYTPVLVALAQSFVMKEFWRAAVAIFSDEGEDPRVRHGVAAAFKVTAVQHTEAAILGLGERCGAQGLFEHNQISSQLPELQGAAIAEGDLMGLSIRLASEIILERYELPSTPGSTNPLAKHEQGLIAHAKHLLSQMPHHRSAAFNLLLLPRCRKIVQSIGHRMAYEAAVAANIDARITDLYLASTMRLDEAWYSENMGLGQERLFEMEEEALSRCLPCLDEWLGATGVERYVKAPIVSSERWDAFVDGLEEAPRAKSVVRNDILLEKGQVRAHL